MYTNQDYLCHYGVPGMRWGQRRAMRKEQIRSNMRETRRGLIENTRDFNKRNYDQVSSNINRNPKISDKRKAKLHAYNKASLDTSEVSNKYSLARIKAKQDPNYKNSDEYKQAKQDFGKQYTKQMLLGYGGQKRFDMYKNLGDSSKKAATKVVAEQVLLGLGVSALAYASVALTNRY